MAGKTTIEWTHMPGFEGDVWNPTTGCTRVSAGCDNCYAFTLHDKRYAANLSAAVKFLGEPDRRNAGVIAKARARSAVMPWPRQYDLPFSRVQLLPDRIEAPLRKRKPTCYFVDSMADLFHDDVPDEYLDRVFATMEVSAARVHKFLILTKRPKRMREYLTARWHANDLWPDGYRPRHIWLGTSVEDQASFDERVPDLVATPAAVRFLSCEPLLGPLDIQYSRSSGPWKLIDRSPIQWVIVGGESGPRARPMNLMWARSIRSQCQSSVEHVAFFMKQLGSNPGVVNYVAVDEEDVEGEWEPLELKESHGRDMAEWPEDLRIREWPSGYTP